MRKLIYNKEYLLEISKNCKNKDEFEKKYPSEYYYSYRRKLLDELFGIHDHKYKNYTKEFAIEESKKYASRTEFRIKNLSLYTYSIKNKLMDELYPLIRNKDKVYSKEYILEEVKKYHNITEFSKRNEKLYDYCRNNNMINEISKTMLFNKNKNIKPLEYWTKQRIIEEKSKYDNFESFKNERNDLYEIAVNNGFIDEVINKNIYPKGYWNKNTILETAKKYSCRSEFYSNSAGAYNAAVRLNILDECCEHMLPKASLKNRLIYVFEFEDNHAYVGLTYNLNKRHKDHLKYGSVKTHIDNTGLIPTLKQLTEYIEVNESGVKEKYYIKKYENDGWILLNKNGGGGLGSMDNCWSYDKCLKIALLCSSKTEFNKKSYKASKYSRDNGFYDEITKHFKKHEKIKLTFDEAKELPIIYPTRSILFRGKHSYYDILKENDWLDLIYLLIKEEKIINQKPIKLKKVVTYNEIFEISKLYKGKTDFYKNKSYLYVLSKRNGWLDLLYPNKVKKNKKIYWTEDKILVECLKYETKSDFKKGSSGAWEAARITGILDKCYSHMIKYQT